MFYINEESEDSNKYESESDISDNETIDKQLTESESEPESDTELSEVSLDVSLESEEEDTAIDIISDHIDLMDMIEPIQMIDNNYYIGYYTFLDNENKLLMVNKIHPKTFMKFNSDLISKYFFWYSGMVFNIYPKIDILQLQIDSEYEQYTVIIKTFWIKIIQRTWKRIYSERKKYLEHRKRLPTIRNYEIGIQKPIYRYLGLYGLLTVYNKNY